VDGTPIDEYNLRTPAASISYTLDYELEQARLYAGITASEFDVMPGTPMWCTEQTGWRSKCHILLLYRMSLNIPAVANDAASKQMERESRMKRH
jgi:hypothetical protein